MLRTANDGTKPDHSSAAQQCHSFGAELGHASVLRIAMDCMEAVDRVEEHDDDRREMIDEICLVIDKFSATGKVMARRRINLAIATYFSLSRAAEISRMLCDELDLSDYNL